MQINKSGGYDQAAGVQRFVGRSANLPGSGDFGHAPVAQQHVEQGIGLARRIDDAAPANQKRTVPLQTAVHHAAPKARAKTAMRTASPLCTCSRITDCGPSATSEVSSMPRITGPGCITNASRFAIR